MESASMTPTTKKLLEELAKSPGTQEELSKRVGVYPRTIRDALRSLKLLGKEIPYVVKNHGLKVFYLKQKPDVIEEKKESKTEDLIKKLLEQESYSVYSLSSKLNLSLSRIREILTKINAPSTKTRSGKKFYYFGKKPEIKDELSESQKKILKVITKQPKTSAQISQEVGIGFKAVRDLIKKIKSPHINIHKIHNIVYYCLVDFDPVYLDLKNDNVKRRMLELITKEPITPLQLSRKLSVSPRTIYEKIIQLKSSGNRIKTKKEWREKYYYIGEEPKIERTITDTQKAIIDKLKKGEFTALELAGKLNVREETILDNIKTLELHGQVINKVRNGNRITFSLNPIKQDEDEEEDELEIAAKATYNIPESTEEKPFIIQTQSKDFFKIGVANTVYGGVRTDKGLFRNFLRYCQQDKCDAIILNGNLIWMDLMTYSKTKPDRARISSRKIDPSFIEYPATVKKYRDPEKLLENGDTVYITFKEKLDMILKNELAPLFTENNLLLFDKKIYLLFGGMEDELRRQHTNLLNRIKNRKEIEFVNNKILDLRFAIQKTPEDKQLQKEMDDWEDYKSRIMMSNMDDVSTQRISRAMQGYIIQKLETAIPNSMVISVGEGFIKANETEIMVLYNARKTTDSISDHLINYAISKIQARLGSGKETVPDIVLTGGLSPYYAAKPITYATRDRGTKVTTIIQLPTCLEENELKKLVRTSVSSKDVLTKLGSNIKLATGALVIENHNGINKRKLLTCEFLTNNVKQDKLFYELNVSDEHIGSKFVSVVDTKDDVFYFTEAYQQMLCELDAPICRINNLGDEIQGLNYEVWKEKHPDFLETHELLKYLENNPTKVKKITKLNSIRTGVLLPPDQINLYIQIQNYRFLNKVLNNADRISLYGGVINLTEGNHSEGTEGFQISTRDIQKEFIYKLKSEPSKITADIFGMTGLKESIFGIADKNKSKEETERLDYLYAEYNRHVSPGSKNKSYASLLLDRRLQRGRTFKHHEGRTLISRFGHVHAGLEAYGNNNIIISCFCGQERTDFGESRDYPLAVVGVRIVGYPSNGLKSGPVVFIDLFKKDVESYINGNKIKSLGLFE